MNQYYGQGFTPYGKVPCNLDNVNVNKGNLPTRKEKRKLLGLSTIVGFCMIAYFLVSSVIGKLIIHFGIVQVYFNDEFARASMETIMSILCILGPFLLGLMLIKLTNRNEIILRFNKPRSIKLMIYSVLIGLLALVVSNFLTSVFVYFMDSIGVVLTSPESETFNGTFGMLLLYLVRGALCPALIEEFTFRGVVMQPLRKYGDMFAIITSSILFAVMHGNLVQAPFAFLIGAVIGYVVIVTESMWTGVLIHFINNAYAIIMTALASKVTDEVYTTIFIVASFVFIIVGIVGLTLLLHENRNKYILYNRAGNYKPIKKRYNKSVYGSYFLSPVLIIAFGIIIYNMSEYVSFGG